MNSEGHLFAELGERSEQMPRWRKLESILQGQKRENGKEQDSISRGRGQVGVLDLQKNPEHRAEMTFKPTSSTMSLTNIDLSVGRILSKVIT